MTLWMSREVTDGNVKRRLSLRSGGSPEKKSRSVVNPDSSKDFSGRLNPDWRSENDNNARTDNIDSRPNRYTANMDIDSTMMNTDTGRLSTSTQFRLDRSAASSSSDSAEDESEERPQSARSQSGETIPATLELRSRPMVPTWATSAPAEGEGNAYSSSSSRSSIRPHPYPQLSTSAPSRVPSPPAFTMPSGQALVNPPLKTQAAFVGKLYAMLEDEEITRTGLIHWSTDGSIFTCPNPTEFAK